MNKPTEDGSAGSLQRLVRPRRLPPEELEKRRGWIWKRNVNRLKIGVLNILTLGLGEDVWYGDIPDKHLNLSLLARFRRFVRVNLDYFKGSAVSHRTCGDQITNPGNERKRGVENGIDRIDGDQVEEEQSHKHTERPNRQKLSGRREGQRGKENAMNDQPDKAPPVRCSAMLEREGFYIATDASQPGVEVPLFVKQGHLYALLVGDDLTEGHLGNSVTFHGPFRAPTEKT